MSEHEQSTDAVSEVETGAFTISYRVHVNADVDHLWQLAVNPHRHHELDGSGTLSQKVTGPEELRTDDTFHIWMRRAGIRYTLPMRVVTADPHREIAWQHPSKHVWHWQFEPADDGGTWVTETFDYRAVSPIVLRLWKLLDVYRGNARDIRATLEQLQDRFSSAEDVTRG